MQPVNCDCEFESEVLAAVLQSRWPERVDASLRAHVAGCVVCADVAAIAGVIDEARQELRASATIPDSGRVWWLAQMRSRREAIRTAERPLAATQFVAGACAAVLLGACLVWAGSALASLSLGFGSLTGLLAEHSLIALGMAAVLFLVPAAAWLALRRE